LAKKRSAGRGRWKKPRPRPKEPNGSQDGVVPIRGSKKRRIRLGGGKEKDVVFLLGPLYEKKEKKKGRRGVVGAGHLHTR